MTPKKEHYYRTLYQKQSSLSRTANQIGSAEIEQVYGQLCRAKQSFLEITRKKLTPSILEDQVIVFCHALPLNLNPVFREVCRIAVDHAIDDFCGRELSLIQDIDEKISAPSSDTLKNCYSAISAESKVGSLNNFALRVSSALKQGLSEHNGLDVEVCLQMIGQRINSFLANLRRIVFTEICSTYNFTQLLCYDEVFQHNSKLMMRWSERIDDSTGLPMHGSVSKDSVAMHGQVIRPREQFCDADGGRWFHPPNRPYDHAVMMFWHPALSVVPTWKHVKKGKNNGTRS